MQREDQERLKSWFKTHGRELPWRIQPTPYSVWVSEVMLQQTRVDVVIPRFMRWMERFPSVTALAAAKEEEVIKEWEGLGYYSRARRLWKGSCQIVSRHEGKLPQTKEGLLAIEGIGPYTAGAIMSFAYGERSAAVDGNVMRVLTRYYGIEECIDTSSTQKKIWQLAEQLLPDHEAPVVTEGLIEIGALICNKKALCDVCPLAKGCVAKHKNIQTTLPKRKKSKAIEKLERVILLIKDDNHLLVRPPATTGLMASLWQLPYRDSDGSLGSHLDFCTQWVETEWKVELFSIQPLATLTHSFTHYHVKLYPFLVSCKKNPIIDGYQNIAFSNLSSLSFPSGHRQLVEWLVSPLDIDLVG